MIRMANKPKKEKSAYADDIRHFLSTGWDCAIVESEDPTKDYYGIRAILRRRAEEFPDVSVVMRDKVVYIVRGELA